MPEHECTCQTQAIVEELQALTERLNGLDRRLERAVKRGARKARDVNQDRLVAVAVRGGRR